MTIKWPEDIPFYIRSILERKFANPFDILFQTEVELAECLGLSVTTAREVQQLIARKFAPSPVSALEALIAANTVNSSLPSLDDFIGGGLQQSWLVEIVGEAGSGKTQWALSMTACALLQGRKVFWIDTENTFRPDRLLEILSGRSDLLLNLLMKRCPCLTELLDSFMTISSSLEDEPSTNVPLIVLDSIAAIASSQSCPLIDRTELLYRITRLAKSVKAVTVVTNHIRTRFNEFGSRNEPALGNFWTQSITCRFALRLTDSFSGKARWIEVVKAPGIDPTRSFKVNISIDRLGIREM
jgi:RecA/RadA recombinase